MTWCQKFFRHWEWAYREHSLAPQVTHSMVILNPVFSESERLRTYLIGSLSGLAALYGIGFGLAKLLAGTTTSAVIDFMVAAGFGTVVLLVLTRKSSRVAAWLLVVIACVFFMYLLVTTGSDKTGALWSFLVPSTTLFLLGKRSGLAATAAYLFVGLFFLFGEPLYREIPLYSNAFTTRFLAVYVMILITVYISDYHHRRVNAALTREIQRGKVLEGELLYQKTKAERIFDIAPAAIFTVSRDRKVISFNREAEKLTGYTREEIINQSCSVFAEKACHRCNCEIFDQSTAPVRRCEATVRCKDGSIRKVMRSTETLYDSDGVARNAIECLTDITDIRKAEHRLRRSRLRAELSSKKAREANAAKSLFLASMSHEIRTPLNGILGMNDLLLDTPLSDEQREFATSVDASAHLLLHLITDILDLSSIEANRLHLDTSEYNLRETIEAAMELIACRATGKKVDIVTHIDPRVPLQLRGDGARLKQVILNIAGNAVKFTHAGEVVLRVTLLTEDHHEAVLGFSISDTGGGIPREHQKEIFEPFHRAVHQGNDPGGTGLGLAIARRVISAMKGSIDFRSTPGQGTEFSFTIRQENASTDSSETSPFPSGTTVLLLDPAASSRQSIIELLRSWNVHVMASSGQKEALEILGRQRAAGHRIPVVILSPGFDQDAASIVHAVGRECEGSSTRIILLTPLWASSSGKTPASVPVDAHLKKPLKSQALKECIRAQLQLPESQPVAPAADVESDKPEPAPDNFILLVEDNRVNQMVVSKLLKKSGFSCEIVENGQKAVDVFKKERYRVVLMDCRLPVLSGYEATAAIREQESRAGLDRTPILALTANAVPGEKAKCLDAGMDDYISKPVNAAELIRKVEKWIGKTVS